MSEIAIQVEDLWKQYRIGHKKSTSFRESVGHWFSKSEEDYFWALKELNFEVKRGEAVGIIGKNGAGKSTLLKVLSKITYPTKGSVSIYGRVSSLLEVGTGFHPELTGRQNVFLNGTILGMRRKEINAKFDEIVAFSGVEKFIDTPVKHYSSGMKVRLAFSVAAHLEPEILIIDEVLAVGDAEFQKKCLGKMEDVTGEGRTVLFVSHNMGAVEMLCQSVIELKGGQVVNQGNNVSEVIGNYLSGFSGRQGMEGYACWINDEDQHFVNPIHTIDRVALTDDHGGLLSSILTGNIPIIILIEGDLLIPEPTLNIGYAIYSNGTAVYWSWLKDSEKSQYQLDTSGHFKLKTSIPAGLLSNGQYTLEVFSVLDKLKNLIKKGEGIRVPFEIEGAYSGLLLHPKFDWVQE